MSKPRRSRPQPPQPPQEGRARDLGTPELRQHHAVEVHRGLARVLTERPIDVYRYAERITVEQWQAGNRLHGLFVWAGLSPWREPHAYREYVTPPHENDTPPPLPEERIDAYGALREAEALLVPPVRRMVMEVCCIEMTLRITERALGIRHGTGIDLLRDGLDILARRWNFIREKTHDEKSVDNRGPRNA